MNDLVLVLAFAFAGGCLGFLAHRWRERTRRQEEFLARLANKAEYQKRILTSIKNEQDRLKFVWSKADGLISMDDAQLALKRVRDVVIGNKNESRGQDRSDAVVR